MPTDAPAVESPAPESYPIWVGVLVTAAFLLGSALWVGVVGVFMAIMMFADGSFEPGRQLQPDALSPIVLGGATLVQFAGMAGLVVLIAYFLPRKVPDTLGARVPPVAGVIAGLVGGCVVGVFPGKIAEELMHRFPVLDLHNMDAITSAMTEGSLFGRALMLIAVCVGAPLVEELAFRGLLFDAVGRSTRPWVAWLFTSLLFATYHVDPVQVVGVSLTGLFLGWLRMTTKSVWPGVIAHAGNNTLATIVAFTYGMGAHDEVTPWWQALVALAITLGAGAFAMIRFRKSADEPAL